MTDRPIRLSEVIVQHSDAQSLAMRNERVTSLQESLGPGYTIMKSAPPIQISELIVQNPSAQPFRLPDVGVQELRAQPGNVLEFDLRESSVREQPNTTPRLSMMQVRFVLATGTSLKRQLVHLKEIGQRCRDQADNNPISQKTLDAMQDELTDLCARQQELTQAHQEYRLSVHHILDRVEQAKAKGGEQLNRLAPHKRQIKSVVELCREAKIVHKEMLFTLRDFCDETIAMVDAVELKQEAEADERPRRVRQMTLRVLEDAEF